MTDEQTDRRINKHASALLLALVSSHIAEIPFPSYVGSEGTNKVLAERLLGGGRARVDRTGDDLVRRRQVSLYGVLQEAESETLGAGHHRSSRLPRSLAHHSELQRPIHCQFN